MISALLLVCRHKKEGHKHPRRAAPGNSNRGQRCVSSIESLTYDFATMVGHLMMPRDSYANMGAAIALFEAIDARVREIHTFNGDLRDVLYFRHESIGWRAHPESEAIRRRREEAEAIVFRKSVRGKR